MKNLLLSAALAISSLSLADEPRPITPEPTPPVTVIEGNRITAIRRYVPVERNGSPNFLATVHGKVDFSGPGPVFVSLRNGFQSYTIPTDPFGYYSVFIGIESNSVETIAWVPGSNGPMFKKTLELK